MQVRYKKQQAAILEAREARRKREEVVIPKTDEYPWNAQLNILLWISRLDGTMGSFVPWDYGIIIYL